MILENKYKIGQKVWSICSDEIFSFTIDHISNPDGKSLYYRDKHLSNGATENEIYPDKQSALAELNKIKVGDVVYFLDVDPKWDEILIKKARIDDVLMDRTYVLSNGDIVKEVFRSEQELVESIRYYE